MKPLKYTVAALALIAAASFTQSAHAAAGDVMLGLYDSNTTGVPTSYEVDLGAFSTLTAGESFNLGSTISSTFSGDSSAALEYNIAASGSTGAGGLASKEIAFTAVTLPTLPSNGGNTTPSTDINNMDATFNSSSSTTLNTGTSSSGVGFTIGTVANSTASSFASEINVSGAVYGLPGGQMLDAYPATDDLAFYTVTNKASGQETATLDGTFQFSTDGSGNEILTFDPTATPEPSAYALGLCAVALFWVLKRRSSVA